jgi:addiction module HigA family antidote
MKNNMRPIHPGEVLREEIAKMDFSANRLAGALKVPANRITGILNEVRSITADTALRLGRFFENSPEFWLNLQVAYDLRKAQLEKGAQIFQEVDPKAA